MTTDLAGNARIQQGTVDMGAYESAFTGNTTPTITASSALTRQQGSAGTSSTIATVSDAETAAGSLTVTVTSANPSNGLTLSNLVNTNGTVTADIVAACGATNASFTLQVSDGTATATATLNVTVTAAPAPIITTQPTAQTVCAGATATFSVAASNAVSYQWRKNAVPISGATASSYTTPATTMADHGALYSVVITGLYGTSVTSSAATLAVTATTAITTQPTNQSACLGGAASFSVTATGTNLTYQWRKGGVAIGGATLATYNIASVTAGDAASYDVIVTGACGTVTSSAATLAINASTNINTQPQNQTACVGGSATFTVAANGSGTVTYQWRKGGVAIGGATSASLTINPVAAGDAGSYDVVVGSNCGTPTSTAATLTVNTIRPSASNRKARRSAPARPPSSSSRRAAQAFRINGAKAASRSAARRPAASRSPPPRRATRAATMSSSPALAALSHLPSPS